MKYWKFLAYNREVNDRLLGCVEVNVFSGKEKEALHKVKKILKRKYYLLKTVHEHEDNLERVEKLLNKIIKKCA